MPRMAGRMPALPMRADSIVPPVRSAERFPHPPVLLRWRGLFGGFGLLLVRPREDGEQLLEGSEIFALDGGFDHFFDAMIARDEGGVDGIHRRLAIRWGERLLVEALLPADEPFVERRRFVAEELAD